MKKSKNQKTHIPARIQKGSFDCKDDSVSYIVNRLTQEFKFSLEDLKCARIDAELCYEYCFYEPDSPSIKVTVSWPDIE